MNEPVDKQVTETKSIEAGIIDQQFQVLESHFHTSTRHVSFLNCTFLSQIDIRSITPVGVHFHSMVQESWIPPYLMYFQFVEFSYLHIEGAF